MNIRKWYLALHVLVSIIHGQLTFLNQELCGFVIETYRHILSDAPSILPLLSSVQIRIIVLKTAL